MKKSIVLSLLGASCLLATSASAVEVKNLDYSTNVGVKAFTVNNHTYNVLDKESSAASVFADISVKGDLSKDTSFKIRLAGQDSLDAKYSFQGDKKSSASLVEANVKYHYENNIITLGRTVFDSPLIYSDNYFAIPNSYDMLSVVNNSLPNTYLFGGIILRENKITDLSVDKTVNVNGNFAPIYIAGGLFAGIKEFPVQAWGYFQENGIADFSVSTESKFTIDLNLGLQYYFLTNGGMANDKAVTLLGAKVMYDINEFWDVDIAFSNNSSGSSWNSSANRSNQKTSKVFTSLRGGGQFTGYDEASVNDTTGFMAKAKGSLDFGELDLAVGSYHHKSGVSYNPTNSSTTHVIEVDYKTTVFDNVELETTYAYTSYEVANITTPTTNDRKDGHYFGASLNYSF